MEHTQAIETNAPDRYVLGMLSAAEADAFEEHYFDCPACADDVRLGMTIMEGGRRLVRQADEPAAPPVPLAPVVPIASRPRWSKWIPAAAAAALVAIPINFALLMRMQNAVPRMAATLATAEVYVPLSDSREATAAAEPLELAEGESALLMLDVRPGLRYPRYEARVLRGQEVVHVLPVSPHLVKARLNVTIPDPGPGTYDVMLLGFDTAGQDVVITRGRFTVKRLNSGP